MTKSQTEWITTYKIPCLKDGNCDFTLNIIDTPGFGDTRGIVRDKQIVTQVDKLFRSKGPHSIQVLDAVCLVAQSPLRRLTHNQQYIFDSILAIFGKDIGNNILVLITFADGKTPPVLKALKEANVPFYKHFKFNNSALFEKNNDSFTEEAKIRKMYWDMGEESFRTFFDHLKAMTPKCLQLTTEVLHNRSVLETMIAGLQKQVAKGMNILTTIRNEAQVLKHHKSEMERNKCFSFTVAEVKLTEIKLKSGEYVTYCLKCNFTCHYPCSIPKNEDLSDCYAMSSGSCTICNEKCHWTMHRNADFRFETVKQYVTKTSDDLKRKYDLATRRVKDQSANLDKIKAAFLSMQNDVAQDIKRIRECINKLEKIALKPCPLTDVEFIDILIRSEEMEKKPGWDGRVKLLKTFRQEAEMIKQAKTGTFKPFDVLKDIIKEFDI